MASRATTKAPLSARVTVGAGLLAYPNLHEHNHDDEEQQQVIIEGSLMYVITAVGIVANVLLILGIVVQRKLRRMTTAFLIHSCILNMVQVAFCIPYALALSNKDYAAMCNSFGTVYIVLMTSSIFNLVAIVCCEVYMFGEENIGGDDAKGSVCCVMFGMSLVYTGSVVLHLGPTIIGGNFQVTETNKCYFVYGQSKNYIVYLMWIIIVSIALSAGVYYLVILYRTVQRNTDHRVTTLVRASVNFNSKNNRNLKMLLSNTRNRAKVLTAVFLLHCVCWYPLFLITIIDPRYNVPVDLYKFFTLFGWTNAAVEPFVYMIGDKQINRKFLYMLPFMKKRRLEVTSRPPPSLEQNPLMTHSATASFRSVGNNSLVAMDAGQPFTLSKRVGQRLCHTPSPPPPPPPPPVTSPYKSRHTSGATQSSSESPAATMATAYHHAGVEDNLDLQSPSNMPMYFDDKRPIWQRSLY